MKANISFQIPEVVTYVPLVIPREFDNVKQPPDSFRDLLLLQVQGEAVSFSEAYFPPALLLALVVVHRVCPEAVFVSKDGETTLLFDHQSRAVIRPQNLRLEFIISDKEQDALRQRPSQEERVIDIDVIQARLMLKNQVEQFRACLSNVGPCQRAVLRGTNALFLLLIAHTLFGLAEEIWYARESSATVLRIY